MAMEIKIPELGENITEGDIVNVLVAVGDTIDKDQNILEIETGKASIEVPSPTAGTISDIRVKAGDKVKVGQIVMTLESQGDTNVSERKAMDAPPETNEPSPEKDAPAEKQEGITSEEPATPTPASPPAASSTPVAAAPSVRQFAREIGIEIHQVPGSGAHGRVSIDDVKAFAKQLNTSRASATGVSAITSKPLPDFSKWGTVKEEDMSTIRKMTAEHMAYCWGTIPHVTQHDKADITELDALRKRFAPKAEAVGGKLTITAILIKIIAAALKVQPKFNASIDVANNKIIYKDYINIGIAVDTPKGLVVPVIRDVDTKNIIQLSVELGEIAKKARDGKITPDDMSGGTFTLTNLGGIGGSFFTPIVNAPEVAILGVGRGEKEPCMGKDGICMPRLRLPLSLSYDHRLIDGADGARFIRWIVEAAEEPLMISLEG